MIILGSRSEILYLAIARISQYNRHAACPSTCKPFSLCQSCNPTKGVRHMTWWLIVLAAVVAAMALAVWWWLPQWQVERLRREIPDAKARADVEDNFRKSIGQLIGG
jgi:hypothetical protein